MCTYNYTSIYLHVINPFPDKCLFSKFCKLEGNLEEVTSFSI